MNATKRRNSFFATVMEERDALAETVAAIATHQYDGLSRPEDALNDDFYRCQSALADIDPRLGLVVGGLVDAPELVITAGGNPAVFGLVTDLVGNAPDIPGWFVRAFRPRLTGDHVPLLCIRVGDQTLGVCDITYHCEPSAGGTTVDLTLRLPGYDDSVGLDSPANYTLAEAGVLLLDHILGEYDAVTRVGDLTFTGGPLTPDRPWKPCPTLLMSSFLLTSADRYHWPHRSRRTSTMDEHPIYEKVRALLRKAESTTFPAEAETLTAKAQELLTRYALDVARLDANSQTRSVPTTRRVTVDGTYATARATLLTAVSDVNGCRTVWDGRAKTALVTGFGTDIDAALLLWHSLMVQAERDLATATGITDSRGRNRTKSYRNSFWLAFTARIRARLAAQRQATAAEVDLLPVLASRQAEVDQAFAAEFPRVTCSKVSASNGGGWAAGTKAADKANLAPRHQLR